MAQNLLEGLSDDDLQDPSFTSPKKKKGEQIGSESGSGSESSSGSSDSESNSGSSSGSGSESNSGSGSEESDGNETDGSDELMVSQDESPSKAKKKHIKKTSVKTLFCRTLI